MIVVWRVTEKCNLACSFCSYDRRLQRTRLNADPAQLRAFGATLSAFQKCTGERVLVSWLGGEPLLWEPLSELTRVYQGEYGLSVSTTTNGTRLDDPVTRKHLIQHYAELTVSIDGPVTLHDSLRGCAGLFERLQKNVRRLAAEIASSGRGPKLRANIILMRTNIAGFADLCHEVASWGITEICFNQLGGNDRPEFFPENRLQPEQVEFFRARLPSLREDLSRRGVRLLGGPGYIERITASATGRKIAVDDCQPGAAFLFIDEGGRVAPCSFTGANYGISVNSLRSVEDLRTLPSVFSKARQDARAAGCDDCLSTHVFTKFSHSHGS